MPNAPAVRTLPLVSVILPVRNRAAWVARAVTSALEQTYAPIEVIAIDDGSTDETRSVLDSFGDRIVVLPRAPDDDAPGGAYAARNRGIQAARGEFIAFLDSDDRWFPDHLTRLLPLMSRSEVGLVFGDALYVRANGPPSPRASPPVSAGRTCFDITRPHRGRVAAALAWGNFIPTTTVVVRRQCLDEVGGFSLENPLSVDYLTWFRIATRHEVDYVDEPVAEYAVHGGGISQNLGRSLLSRIDLFSAELARTADAPARAILRRMLFNLSLHLALAAVRGRARHVPRAMPLAWRTAREAAGLHAPAWALAFAAHQIRTRGTQRRMTPITRPPPTGGAFSLDSSRPLVSVVIETVTLRESGAHDLVPDLCRAIDAVLAQTYPADRIDIVVVFDIGVSARDAEHVRRLYPAIRVVYTPDANYCAEKNAGAAHAIGAIVALVDGDCAPDADWLAVHVARMEEGADVVAGSTRYSGGSRGARLWSVPDFANVTGEADGQATGLLVNNVSFRRDVFLAHPLNPRIWRDGGCYLLYHTLRRHDYRIAYAPRAIVSHGFDVDGVGFVKKHFGRGFDNTNVYRVDDEGVLRGTRLVKQFGPLALFPLTARRLALDGIGLVRRRKELNIPAAALPFYMVVMLTTRTIELAGGLLAFLDPGWRERHERRERLEPRRATN